MIGDLHCHTKISDGSSSIADLIFSAKRAGLDFVAITDHDSMAAVTRAAVLGKRYGIHVIPGVEFSCRDHARERPVHIICYLPRHPDRLEGACMRILERRTAAGKKIIENVMRCYPITPELVDRYSSHSKSIYKQHIMHALMDLGYTDRIYGELFDSIFRERADFFGEPIEYPDVREILGLIREAKGIACLAHPELYDSMELLEQLAADGSIQAVEQHHPRHSADGIRKIGEIAGAHRLICTGGSDFHGYYTRDPNPMATCITTKPSIEALFARYKAL